MICKNCNKEFDSNLSNCPHCHYPAYPQDSSTYVNGNQANNNFNYQQTNSQNNNSGYSNAQSNMNYQSQNFNSYNQPNNQQNYQNYNQNYQNYNQPQETEESTSLMKVLGFFLGVLTPMFWFLPIISIVLYFVWKSDKPKSASAIGKFTIIGVLVGYGISILLGIILAVVFIALAAGPFLEFAQDFIVEIFEFIPFESIRELLRNIFELLPFEIELELNGASLLSIL